MTQPSKREEALHILSKSVIKLGKVLSPNTFYLPSPPVHYEITQLMMDETVVKQNIIAPRGIAKTSLATMYITQHLKLGPPGKKLVVIISKTQTHAKSILNTVKNIIEFSDGYRKLFGYEGSLVAKIWREDKLVLPNGDAIVARGTGQPIRGVNEQLQRPTLIVVDDPEDENNTKTIEAMEHNVNWILTAVVPALDAHRGRIIVIGTPLHEKCIVMTLAQMESWKTVHFGNNLEEGLALWPESKPLQWLQTEMESMKAIGKLRIYYQEYECNLIPGMDALFRKEYINVYDEQATVEFVGNESYLKFPSGLLLPVNIYMGIDPASTVSQSADYSTIVPVAVASDMRIFILDYFRKRVPPLAHAEAIESFFLRLRPRVTLVEATGYQDMLRGYLRSRIFIPGLETKETPHDTKEKRYIEMLQPYFAQGKVYLKGTLTNGKYSGSQQDLYDELMLFPKSKHDDLLDGLYYACKRIRPPSHTQQPSPVSLPEHQQVLVGYYEKKEETELPMYVEEEFD